MLLADESSHQRVADIIASVVTRKRGECLIKFGLHPSQEILFASNSPPTEPSSDNAEGWTGSRVSEGELNTLIRRLTAAVDEFGGKVTRLYEHPTRATCLVRLPPPSVESTPEVRCAVVGNVDSGKSTTLGVLTRGALDDGRGRARVGLFRHKHEIETGRTSSVGMEVR